MTWQTAAPPAEEGATTEKFVRPFFWFLGCCYTDTASPPITSGTHTGGRIGKPGSAWPEGTPAIELELQGNVDKQNGSYFVFF